MLDFDYLCGGCWVLGGIAGGCAKGGHRCCRHARIGAGPAQQHPPAMHASPLTIVACCSVRAGRTTPSVAVIVQPGSQGGFQKLFFGQEEIAIPQVSVGGAGGWGWVGLNEEGGDLRRR